MEAVDGYLANCLNRQDMPSAGAEQNWVWPNLKAAGMDYSPTLHGLGAVTGYLPGGALSWHIPGVPRHLQGILGGGLLGAALGYGAGKLGSGLLPKKWDKTKLPRTLTVLVRWQVPPPA